MNDATGTTGQAVHDQPSIRRGVHRLVDLFHRLSEAISRRDSGADGTRQTNGRDIAPIIARRAERVNNRSRAAADRYIAVHQTLAKGR